MKWTDWEGLEPAYLAVVDERAGEDLLTAPHGGQAPLQHLVHVTNYGGHKLTTREMGNMYIALWLPNYLSNSKSKNVRAVDYYTNQSCENRINENYNS